jgi:hypothetical protein
MSAKAKDAKSSRDVDDFLARVPQDARVALEKLRRQALTVDEAVALAREEAGA